MDTNIDYSLKRTYEVYFQIKFYRWNLQNFREIIFKYNVFDMPVLGKTMFDISFLQLFQH